MTADGGVAAPDDPECRPMACRADCECLGGEPASGGNTCAGGLCGVSRLQATGLCIKFDGGTIPGEGWPTYCACNGGTCDARQCCVLPDGTVAQTADPACRFPASWP
jgi:hypothetical protein